MTGTIQKYIFRQSFLPAIFAQPVRDEVGMVITIPAYAEEEVLRSLQSLADCTLPPVSIEVIVLINHPEHAPKKHKEINQKMYESATKWAKTVNTDKLQFLISPPQALPKKQAGAGLARKIAMDEAVRRLQNSHHENPVIAAFDGDATCESSYLLALYDHFKIHPDILGCAIYFEHPLHEAESSFNQECITQYELHLRYYQAALVYAKHPYAEFTVGSSMAVTRDAYVLQGGMNRRKAGEDFWFMLKLMMAGKVNALTNTVVYPSCRESFRVPFGTGRSMTEMHQKNEATFYTSRFASFEKLRVFLEKVDDLHLGKVRIDDALTLKFLAQQNWEEILNEIRLYTTDLDSFKKRFYRWFNVFMVMKFFHFLRDEGEVDVSVQEAALDLLAKMPNALVNKASSAKEILEFLRHKKSVQPKDYTLYYLKE